jgi:glutamyl-tRNA(Gln) amidotransferase subunit D
MQPGDRVQATHKGNKYTGILMPSTERGLTILKLDNGYNIGLKGAKIKKIGATKALKAPTFKAKAKKSLPTILIITTGGTITSRVDYRTGAVHALSKPEELLASVPELSKIANLKVLNPFNVMSEDMTSKEWIKIAQLVAKDKSKGVIITHGTDTLHFTSAALSFFLKDLNKPVALVGGQRSSDRGSFDGAQNLICAAYYCLSNIAEVAVVMHGTTEDDSCIAIRGTKVRKMHTSRRDAFRPINDLPIAQIWPNGKIKSLQTYNRRSKSKLKLDAKFQDKVALVKFSPNLDSGIIDYYVKKKYKGIILEGTGLGHIAIQGKNSWLKSIKKATKKMFIGMTSQTLYGRTDPFVYSNMRILQDAGVVYLQDMLPETAYIKLSYVLAKTKKPKELMLTNLAGEINKRIQKKAYLY